MNDKINEQGIKAVSTETTANRKLRQYLGYGLTAIAVASLTAFLSVDAYAAFDLDAGIKAATDPVKKMINDYYPVGIFITGAFGALMQQQGDLRDRMLGFGKGSLIGGLTVMAVKTGLGV
jgi:hypothetical protein